MFKSDKQRKFLEMNMHNPTATIKPSVPAQIGASTVPKSPKLGTSSLQQPRNRWKKLKIMMGN